MTKNSHNKENKKNQLVNERIIIIITKEKLNKQKGQ